jgi:hypothetical protein
MGQLKILNFLCIVLGLEFKKLAHEVHPSLDGGNSKNLSDDVVCQLASTIQSL